MMLVQSPGVAPADDSGYLAQVTGLQWNLECPISVFYSCFSVFLMLSNIYGHKIDNQNCDENDRMTMIMKYIIFWRFVVFPFLLFQYISPFQCCVCVCVCVYLYLYLYLHFYFPISSVVCVCMCLFV